MENHDKLGEIEDFRAHHHPQLIAQRLDDGPDSVYVRDFIYGAVDGAMVQKPKSLYVNEYTKGKAERAFADRARSRFAFARPSPRSRSSTLCLSASALRLRSHDRKVLT